MKLEDLPGSILRQILNGGGSAIELWKCGNSSLNSRLVNKGVTEINLKDTEEGSTSRWPRCLREFALERLTIDRGPSGPLATTLALQAELKKLSSSLRSLDIIGRGAPKALFFVPGPQNGEQNSSNKDGDVSDDEATDAPPAKRTKLAEDVGEQLHLELWNLDITWPNLERLVVGGDSHGDVFGASVWSLLPRSLTHFDFQQKMMDNACRDMSSLPSGLKTLHLSECVLGKSGLKTLPKSITHLGESCDEDALDELFKHPKLLPNLDEFPSDFDPYSSAGELLEYIYEGKRWPETVHELTIWNVGDDTMFKKLPSKLIYLKSQGGDISTTLFPRHIAGLPRTLETLELIHIQWQGIKVEHWPPTLSVLSVRSVPGFGAHCFQLFPRSLKSFIFDDHLYDFDDPREIRALKKLRASKTIEKLKAIGRECLEMEREQWLVEKARLLTPRYLALGSEAYIKRVEDGELFGLPLTLTALDIKADPVPYPQKLLLPPNVRNHSMEIWIDETGYFDLLPPTDEMCLRVTVERHAEDANPTFATALPSESDLYRSNLVSLNVNFSTPGLNYSVCEYLPRTLRELTLRVATHILNSDLKHLPPTLEKLELCNPLSSPLEPWVHMLPKTLTWLEVDAPIFGSEIAHLPPKLDHLSAHFVSVTLAQARQLPPKLSALRVRWSDSRPGAEKSGFLHMLSWKALLTLCRPVWRIHEYSEAFLKTELELAATKWPDLATVIAAQWPPKAATDADEDGDAYSKELAQTFPTVPSDTPQFLPTAEEEKEEDEEEDGDGEEGDEEVENDGEDEADGDDGEGSDGSEVGEEEEEQNEEDGDAEEEGGNESSRPMIPISDPSEDIDPRTVRRFASKSL